MQEMTPVPNRRKPRNKGVNKKAPKRKPTARGYGKGVPAKGMALNNPYQDVFPKSTQVGGNSPFNFPGATL